MTSSNGPDTRNKGVIVVGVDGSAPSKDALKWAVNQARLSGSRLRAVLSWELPSAPYHTSRPSGLEIDEEAHQILTEEIDEVLGAGTDLEVEKVVAQGHPAPVLLDVCDDADLLVVGSRGHGQFAGMLLGSVSEHCVTHAPCPVVVVRHQRHTHSVK